MSNRFNRDGSSSDFVDPFTGIIYRDGKIFSIPGTPNQYFGDGGGAPISNIIPSPSGGFGPTFRTDTFLPLINPIPVYYGPFRAGGQVICNTRSGILGGGRLVAWVVSLGQINSITSIKVENKTLASWTSSYEVYTGDPAQTASPLLATAFGTQATPFGAGIDPKTGIALAYIVAHFNAPTDTQPDPDPYQFLVEGQGMLVYDPTLGVDGTTNLPTHAKVYSANPYYCMADWVAASTKAYGCCQPVSSIDWSGTVTSSAAAADTDIGGGTKRFTITQPVNSSGDPWQVIENMRATCQGMQPVFNNGLWQFPIDITQSASGIVLTDVGTEANIVSCGPLVVSGPNDVKTRVRVTFTDVAHDYKVDTTPPDDDAGIAGGSVPVEDHTFNIPGIPTYDQAVRIGRYLRKRSAMDKSGTIRVQPDGIQLLPGIRVAITSTDLNFASQAAIITDVVNVPNTVGQWDCRFELYDAAVYDDTKASTTAYAPPAVASPYDTPPTPSAPTLTQEGLNVRVDFSIPSNYQFYGATRITVLQAGGFSTYTLGEALTGPLYIKNVTIGSLYTVKAYTLSTAIGAVSAAATATITPVAETAEWPAIGLAGGTGNSFLARGADGAVTLSLRRAPKRNRVLYGTSYFAQTGIASYDGTKINDGVTNVNAGNVTSGNTLTIDFGAGNAKRVREVRMFFAAWSGAAENNPGIIEGVATSDDGVTFGSETFFTFAPANYIGFSKIGDTPTGVAQHVSDAAGGAIDLGSHRAWRFTFHCSSLTFSIGEFQVYDYASETAGFVTGYNIYDFSTGTENFLSFVAVDHDFINAPVDVSAALKNETTWTKFRAAVRVRGVSADASLSDPLDLYLAYTYVAGNRNQLLSSQGTESVANKTLAAASVVFDVPGTAHDKLTIQGADIASAATTNIGAGTGLNINITGTTAITAFDSVTAGIVRILKFAGILALTHNATTLLLPGAANITTAAGDVAIFESLGSGNWRCMNYMRAAAPPWNNSTSGILGTATNDNAGAGVLGEVIASTIATGSSVSLTSGTAVNITSVSLTAGDWDVSGSVSYTFGATTAYTQLLQGISTTSASYARGAGSVFLAPSNVPGNALDMEFALPTSRLSLATTTTVYLISYTVFSASTLKAYGQITCRRAR